MYGAAKGSSDDVVCVIPGKQVRVFGKAIHTLSKMSDDLYIEARDGSFHIRTVNSARSAYACFDFDRSFFDTYHATIDTAGPADHVDAICCKTPTKTCLATFRSLSQLDKSVTRCKLRLNVRDSFLEVQLHCKHGVVKTHKLHIEDADSIQAVYDTTSMPGEITVPPRLLTDSMVHFHNGTDEITFNTGSAALEIMNWTDETAGPISANSLSTRVELHKDEFSGYKTPGPAMLTFCLKELRAICSFCDYLSIPLRAIFESAGVPIIFLVQADDFSADFVMSTVNNEDNVNDDEHSDIGTQPSGTQQSTSTAAGAATPPPARPRGPGRVSGGPSSFNDTQPRTEDDDEDDFYFGSGVGPMETEVARSGVTREDSFEEEESGRSGRTGDEKHNHTSQPSRASSISTPRGKQRRVEPRTPLQKATAAGPLVKETPLQLTESPYVASMASLTDRRQRSPHGAMSATTDGPSPYCSTGPGSMGGVMLTDDNTPPNDEDSDDEVPATPPQDAQFRPFFRGPDRDSMEF